VTARVLSLLSGFARTVRFVIGAPDFERYAEHMRDHHPSEKPLTRAEFASQRLDDRYDKAGSRCC
jgi:uncharacterized short protein YbdD (DUF466 family)